MTPEQFVMCKKAFEETTQELLRAPTYADGWAACLHANGIGEDVKGKDDGSAAPQWVIDMMRTGKPVQCKVWDGEGENGLTRTIDGYVIGAQRPFQSSMKSAWRHAEPIPTWKPQDGEVVFVHDLNGDVLIGRIIEVGKQDAKCIGLKGVVWELPFSAFKTFDASKVGKPWSEI